MSATKVSEVEARKRRLDRNEEVCVFEIDGMDPERASRLIGSFYAPFQEMDVRVHETGAP